MTGYGGSPKSAEAIAEREHDQAAAEWLAAGSPDPEAVRAAWAVGKAALVPCGVRWDVIRVSHRQGSQVLGDLRRARRVGELGPVLICGHNSVDFLVPVGGAVEWGGRWTYRPCGGAELALPHPGIRHRTDLCRWWWRWPQEIGHLTDPQLIADGLRAVSARSDR